MIGMNCIEKSWTLEKQAIWQSLKFLVCVGLDPNRAYFKQLCTKTITRVQPSKRRKSPEREFRDAVSKYFDNLASNSTRTLSHRSPQLLGAVISDWYLDNRLELRGLGISDIYLSKSNPIGIIIGAYLNSTVSDAEILQMLMKNSKILETVEGMHATSVIVESYSLCLLRFWFYFLPVKVTELSSSLLWLALYHVIVGEGISGAVTTIGFLRWK